jgi:hypothetical protein
MRFAVLVAFFYFLVVFTFNDSDRSLHRIPGHVNTWVTYDTICPCRPHAMRLTLAEFAKQIGIKGKWIDNTIAQEKNWQDNQRPLYRTTRAIDRWLSRDAALIGEILELNFNTSELIGTP